MRPALLASGRFTHHKGERMYKVTTYHGENGSLAWVYRDGGNDEDVAGYFSTTRNGATWKAEADALAAKLNRQDGGR